MKKGILVFILFVIGIFAGYFIVSGSLKPQPTGDDISFSHYAHTTLHKIKCVSCHRGVETQEMASVPNIQVCSMCHSTLMNPKSEREKKIYEYVKENKTIQWKIYYHVPDYVMFSHRRHVKLGKLECTDCHGDMTKQTSPDLKNVSAIKMQFCFSCHEDKKVTTDCNNCHH